MGEYRGARLDELILTSDRLTLRPWAAADAPAVHAIMRDRAMHEFLALPDPYTLDAARSFVTDRGLEGRGDGTGVGCAVVESAGGAIVGAAALRLPSELRNVAEIGYWVAPAAQGNGYAAEAAGTLARWGFAHALTRIELYCDVRNVASAGAALRAGFRFEGVRRGYVIDSAGRHGLAIFGRTDRDDGEPIPQAFPRLPAEGLGDGVVRLRPMRPADAGPSAAQENDPVSLAVGFAGTPWPAAVFVERCERAGLDWLTGRAAPFTIVDVATGRFAGSLHLRHVGPPQVGGIGYTVHPAFRGRRYTSRALRLLAAWAFDVAGYVRLELGAKAHNVASQRAALAAGFAPDGVRSSRLRNPDGSYSDEVRFALISR
jgi:RimJ/RimL family protein N-acetyltransferase